MSQGVRFGKRNWRKAKAMAARAKKAGSGEKPVEIQRAKGESGTGALARVMVGPELRHGHTVSTYAGALLGSHADKPHLNDYAERLRDAGEKAVAGDLAFASRTLAAQAITLDAMFTELARRAAVNMGEYINAADRYARLALKAQANSRATIEALGKLHQPREQTVRHVHVNEGGKAVIADQFYHHAGAAENAQSVEQPHATGTGAASTSPALQSPDAIGSAVPIASGEGQGALSNARGQGQRRT
jgi:hypothetical protein